MAIVISIGTAIIVTFVVIIVVTRIRRRSAAVRGQTPAAVNNHALSAGPGPPSSSPRGGTVCPRACALLTHGRPFSAPRARRCVRRRREAPQPLPRRLGAASATPR